MLSYLLEGVSAGTLREPAEWFVNWMRGGEGRGRRGVTPETAMTFSAVYRAVSLIAGQLATLPLHVYQRQSDGTRIRIFNHPVEQLFGGMANDELLSIDFVELLMSWVLLWGNGYARIEREGLRPFALVPLNPWQVKVRRPKHMGGALVYSYTLENGRTETYDRSEILHIKNLTRDGTLGRSIVTHARETIGLGLVTQEFVHSLYRNDATPRGALVAKAKMTKAQQGELRKSWREMHAGPGKAGSTAVLHGDLEYKQFGMSLVDAQFIDQRKFGILEVARMFGVPPHLLYDLDRATFSNIEAQGIEFLTYSLRYWLCKWAKGIAQVMFTAAERDAGYYAEHKTEALLTTDIKTRYEAYSIARNTGLDTINDQLARENRNPIGPEGDVRLVPSNMLPAEDMLLPPARRKGPEKPEVNTGPIVRLSRAVVADQLRRFDTKEQQHVRDLAKRPERFAAGVEAFYAKHEPFLRRELAAPVATWRAALGKHDAKRVARDLAGRRCAAGRERLLAAVSAPEGKPLAEAVDQALSAIPSILGGLSSPARRKQQVT